MYKKSQLNSKIPLGIAMLVEQVINLGNSDNKFTVFRKHKFTVIRPNLFHDNDVQASSNHEIKLGIGTKLVNKLKDNLPKAKVKNDLWIDINLIPAYVLVNPSQWGEILRKNKDGSSVNMNTGVDTLSPLRALINFNDEDTISVKFKLKDLK